MAIGKSYVSLKIIHILTFLAHAYAATRSLFLKARGENVTNCSVAPWCQDRFSTNSFNFCLFVCFCYFWHFFKE